MQNIVKFLAMVVVALTNVPADAQPPTPMVLETVKAGDISATVRVDEVVSDGESMLGFSFTSNTSSYPVRCLSVFRDVQYDLRDNRGHMIPVNPTIFTNPPYSGTKIQSVPYTPNPSATPMRCDAERHKAYGQTLLRTLYPHLEAGTYTLNMTFAPRGIVQRQPFSPVRIVLTRTI